MVYDLSRRPVRPGPAALARRSTPHTPVGDSMGRITGDSWCLHTVVDTLLFAPGHALVTTVVMVVVMVRVDAGLTLLALAVAPFMAAAAWVVRAADPRGGARPPRDREPDPGARPADAQRRVGGPGVRARGRRAAPLPGAGERGHPRAPADRLRRQRSTGWVGAAHHARHGRRSVGGGDARARRPAHRRHDARLPGLSRHAAVAALGVRGHVHGAPGRRRQHRPRDGRPADDDAVPELAGRAGVAGRARRGRRSSTSHFGYEPDQPVLRDVDLQRRRRRRGGHRRRHRRGEEHAGGPAAALLRSRRGPRAASTATTCATCRWRACASRSRSCSRSRSSFRSRSPRTSRSAGPTPRAPKSRPPPGPPTRTSSSRRCPRATTRCSASAGATLSGGERQRIAIARALLKDAPILILDEPTSALDAETEHAIVEALERLMRGRTTFIVAHRLSTIRHADHRRARATATVVEQGTHASCSRRGGPYADLYHLQFARAASGARWPMSVTRRCRRRRRGRARRHAAGRAPASAGWRLCAGVAGAACWRCWRRWSPRSASTC